jgi:hypothetical protein
MGCQPDLIAVDAVDIPEQAVGDTNRVPGDGVENALEIRGRGGHRAEDLRRGGLLVAGLSEGSLWARGLSRPSRVTGAEQADGAEGKAKAEGEQERDARAPRRPAAFREEGDGERAGGEGEAHS